MLATVATAQVVAGAGREQETAVRGVTVTSRGGAAIVTIAGTGALPDPTVGTINGPPRIYLDFPNVALRAAATTPSTDAKVRRVRVALYKTSPVTTRVVIDLSSPQPFRVELGGDGLVVIVGVTRPGWPAASVPPDSHLRPGSGLPPGSSATSATAAPLPPRVTASAPPPAVRPVPPLPEPPAVKPAAPVDPTQGATAPVPSPPPPALNVPSLPGLPQKDLERFRRQVSGTLERLRLQQPLLRSLDANEDQAVERMQMAADEFERLREEFTAIKPPDTLRAQHAMLVQSSTLAIMAATLQMESTRVGSASIKRNAASAAAGAILLLDRACRDLGCPALPDR